jgi:hypothetical protein
MCDLPCLLTYLDNYANNRHKADATRSPAEAFVELLMVRQPLPPIFLLSPQPPLLPRHAPAAAPPPTAGVFAGIHSRPGDLVDSLRRSGSFAFLSDLFDTERLFELRDFRLARVMPKGEAIEQFAASMHLVLDLAVKYPRDSLAAHILDCVAQFLPALLCPCTRRGRVRQIISNAKRFQLGDWKGLWETALRIARRETDTNTKRKHNRATRDTSSIQARVVYAEHCARRGALSKANQAVTSNSVPNADPINIELLRAKHPEPAHPDRDPVRLSSILWPRPQTLEEHWSSDAGAEFLDKLFSIPKICQYFRTHSPVTMADIDGWHARDLIAPLFFNDNTDLHNLIRKRLILPYLNGSFHPSFIEEYAGGILMALQKQDGGIRPILCGEICRRCFASLAVNATPVRNEAAKLFTSTYDKFIQTAGIRDGASHCAKILSVFYDNLDTSDPNDPEVIIKIDISNAFNTTCRALTLDVLSGRASRDYACGLKHGDAIPTVRTCLTYSAILKPCAKLRYFDWDGQVHLAKGKTGGQQGDPLEMLSVALQVLAELKHVLKQDAGLELNVSKTSILPKGVTAQAAFDVAQNIIQATPTLAHLSGDVLLASFCPEGFVGIGVPIGTDVFVQNFVAKTCRAIIDDVEKLDAIRRLYTLSAPEVLPDHSTPIYEFSYFAR